MARTKGPERKTVSVTLPVGLFNALDEHKWDKRMTFSELVEHITAEYAKTAGLAVESPAPVAEVAEPKAEVPAKKA